MNITINQETIWYDHTITLDHAVEDFNAQEPFAVMVNDEFIAKSEYADKTLNEGDAIEIVGAIQGG